MTVSQCSENSRLDMACGVDSTQSNGLAQDFRFRKIRSKNSSQSQKEVQSLDTPNFQPTNQMQTRAFRFYSNSVLTTAL